ncbi:hypothetical protein EVAR_92623_1 [Eumeta japonica]|uniref:Uncharacterized protein n=1 Tax=Eumeta variegata TaxID=151549 RepID=A0A4C1SWP3_EUMVA|nr:hypothetical protein EVAR_92623_1 [Eumeta japonica]
MLRVRLRKTLQSDLSRCKDAYKEVKAGESPRKAADKRGVDHCCLLRYQRKRHASVIILREKSGVNAPVVNAKHYGEIVDMPPSGCTRLVRQ